MPYSLKKQWLQYLLLHVGLLFAGGLLLFWRALSLAAGISGLYCPIHQLLRLYCPFCGGTRVLASLLRFDFRLALSANPIVFLLIPCFLFFDLRALIRLLRKERDPLRLPRWLVPTVLIAFLLYGFVRNLLLVVFRIDPLGDLLPIYC